MTNQKLQLSESGKKRLLEMLKDARNGDFFATVGYHMQCGAPMYYCVDLASGGFTCAFVSDESLIAEYVVSSVLATLNRDMYFFVDKENGARRAEAKALPHEVIGVSLSRFDYTTPAQRALERMGHRLNGVAA